MKNQIINWYNLPARIHSLFLTKQDKLTAGSNIQIEDSVISVTGGGGSDLMVSITHADLLALVNSSALTKGQQYRITDYVATVDTTVYNPDIAGFFARSNNHAFDIIVVADSENKLNENARAIRHEGDTYFPSHTKFEAWKLKYTIFNDSERFDWALSSGKGVIYQLIDEWNNDLPYDFKSIQFKRNDIWVYTFGGIADDSLNVLHCFENKMLITFSSINGYGYGLNNNTFGSYCFLNTFGNNCFSNTFGNSCYSNIFGVYCTSNTFDIYCTSNTFGDYCVSNTFENYCEENTFGSSCQSNTFGYEFKFNTFGHGCEANIFGNNCQSNTFGDYCVLNTFGDYCVSNIFGYQYRYFNMDFNIYGKDFTTLIPLFTTQQDGNEIKVTKTANGAVMSQVINSTTTESIDI